MFKRSEKAKTDINSLKKQLLESELASSEQKKRILALREENAALRTELDSHIKKSAAVSDALVNAMQLAESIKRKAVEQSNELIKASVERCSAEEQKLIAVRRRLTEMRRSLENILAAISNETDTSLRLISGDD